MAKTIRSKVYTFAQQLDSKYWHRFSNISDDHFSEMFSDLSKFGSTITMMLKKAGIPAHKVAFIVHDKDVEGHGDKVRKKPKHVHGYIELQKRISLPKLAGILGLDKEYVEPLGKGRYAKENSLAYMIHAKQPEKHQYNSTEVWCDDSSVSKAKDSSIIYTGGWYQDYVSDHFRAWQSYVVTAQNKKKQLTVDLLVQEILAGKYRDKDQLILDSDAYDLYIYKSSLIDKAFDTYLRRKALKFAQDLKDGKVSKKVFFITGKPRSGKTKLASKVIDEIQEIHPEWTVYSSGGSDHPWDGYSGQDVVLLDDVRPNVMSASDWTHLLDPHYSYGSLGARYSDKYPAFQVLIITTYLDPIRFFSYLKANEDIDQFLGRITYSAVVASRENSSSLRDYLPINDKGTDEFFANSYFKYRFVETPDVVIGLSYINSNFRTPFQRDFDAAGTYHQSYKYFPIEFMLGTVKGCAKPFAELLCGKAFAQTFYTEYLTKYFGEKSVAECIKELHLVGNKNEPTGLLDNYTSMDADELPF